MYKVIVIEDEKYVRTGIIHGTNWGSVDCKVIGEGKDGSEGVRLAGLLHPDLIITDIRMPGMDGLAMMEEIRKIDSKVKVIFLTAYSDFSYAQTAIRLGAADYLLKPFEDGELESAIRRIFGQKKDLDEKLDSLVPLRIAPSDSQPLPRLIQAAISFIEAHYSEESLSVSEIAKAVNVSEGHLSRLFKKSTGLSIGSYITHYRIRAAARLLRDPGNKVYEVAQMVGYSDVSYFSSLFRKLTGTLPSEFS